MANNKPQPIDEDLLGPEAEVDLTADSGEEVYDFSGIEAPKPVPEGTYFASIVAAQAAMSKNNLPKIALRWKIEEGEHAGRTITDDWSFAPDALQFTKQRLQNLGLGSFKGSRAALADQLHGMTANIRVVTRQGTQIDPATGELYPPRNNVSSIRAAGGGSLG